jgi:hypothetical protein
LREVRCVGPQLAELHAHSALRRYQTDRSSGGPGEYAADFDCCKTFLNSPERVAPKAKYANKVRGLLLEQVLGDGMNVGRALTSLRRARLSDRAFEVKKLRAQTLFVKHFSRLIQSCVGEVPSRMSSTVHRDDPPTDFATADSYGE